MNAEPDVAPDAGATSAVRQDGTPRRAWLEIVAVVALAALVFVVHPVGYMTRRPYWIDEAWVALLSKAPLSKYIGLSSSTPIGWLLLVRWAPVGRDDLRVVSLVFAGGDVVMAYVVVRCLPWNTAIAARFAGAVAAVLVLLAPISVGRDDLKQYTADALFALVIVALACRVEAEPSRRTLAQLAAGSVVAIVFSTVALFVVVAVFSGLVLVALARRSARQIRDLALTVCATAAPIAVYFWLVIIPQDNPALRAYWHDYYLTGSPFHELEAGWQRLVHLSPGLGMPAVLLVVLIALGTVVLAGIGRRAIALAVPLLWIEMILAGRLQLYPFLQQRTSHFLFVFSLAVVAVGVAGVILAVGSRSRVLAVVLTVAAAGAFWHQAEPFIRSRTLQNEDIRSQVQYVARHHVEGDIVVVSLMSSYGFGYYWPGAKNAYDVDHTGYLTSNGYLTRVTNLPGVVYVRSRTATDTMNAVRNAIALARAHGGNVRIWVIRTHVNSSEKRAWDAAIRAFALHPQRVVVGREPLALIRLPQS